MFPIPFEGNIENTVEPLGNKLPQASKEKRALKKEGFENKHSKNQEVNCDQ